VILGRYRFAACVLPGFALLCVALGLELLDVAAVEWMAARTATSERARCRETASAEEV
jgi:hypothetical protein